MQQKITEEELDFFEILTYPVALAEILFSDYDNLTLLEEDKFGHVRLGQYPMISFEYMIGDDSKLSIKQNFDRRKRVGDMWALGGRMFGKTLCLKIDMMLSMFLLGSVRVGFSSYDAIHIRGVLEDIVQVLQYHPIFIEFVVSATKAPNYRFALKTGYVLEGINMNITGKNQGSQFFQKHLHRLFIEEASFESNEIYRQRRDSVSELGCVYRISGMTNFTKYSPCGQAFYDYSKRKNVINLPQKIRPTWDEKEKNKAINDYGGEQSIGYRVFIDGEVVEEGVSVFDIQRVRKNYNEDRQIKFFEITKESFQDFETIIIVDRPKNADVTFICADVGESAPTEIIIIFQIGDKYRYSYNVILYNLTDKQQFKIFQWLAVNLKANYIGIDCTDGLGRAIYRSLEGVFPKENLVWVGFNEKIPIDFETNETGEVVFKGGQPVYKEEFVRDWSIHNLKTLLYGEKMDLPQDAKFDMQFNSVISLNSGTRVIYKCISQEDHLFQGFQVFSIVQWMVAFKLVKPVHVKKFCKSGV